MNMVLKQNNPLEWLGSTEERIVGCQSLSCCSSFYNMNSALGATGVYFASLAKVYGLAASCSFTHYHL